MDAPHTAQNAKLKEAALHYKTIPNHHHHQQQQHMCVSDSGMGSCFSEDVAKYIPFCNKDAASKKADQAKLQPSAFSAIGVDKKPSGSMCPKYNTSSSCDADDLCNW
eukprot:scaffold90179_cov20-Tisochrysis_lutea.AAC.1